MLPHFTVNLLHQFIHPCRIFKYMFICCRLYYAQALNKACLYEEAMKVSCQVESSQYAVRVCLVFLFFINLIKLFLQVSSLRDHVYLLFVIVVISPIAVYGLRCRVVLAHLGWHLLLFHFIYWSIICNFRLTSCKQLSNMERMICPELRVWWRIVHLMTQIQRSIWAVYSSRLVYCLIYAWGKNL